MLGVFTYFNVHKKTFSLKALSGPSKGLVIAHRDRLLLTSVSPRVSQAGRNRVLAERRKNVHAGLVGTWVEQFLDDEVDPGEDPDTLTYNPYKYPFFVAYQGERAYEFVGAAGAQLLVNDAGKPVITIFGTERGAQLLEAA